jgi:hypothetical protein
MSSKYKNKRQEIKENLSIDSYLFFSYYISNAKHITFYLGRPELPGQSVYMENIHLA